MIGYKFSKTADREFVQALNARVDRYFEDTRLAKRAGPSMVTKTVLTFGFYVAVYATIVSGVVGNVALLFMLWAILGVGQALVGMCVMHDKVHGAYSRNRLANLLLEVPIIAIGVESMIWRIEHNVMHHNYTNVEGLDQDIHPRFVFRFSQHQPKRWFHRFQHIYATLFYGLLIIEWLTIKDFLKVAKYRRMEFFKTDWEAWKAVGIIAVKKSIFYGVFLVVPLWVLPYSNATVVLMFVTMLVVAGVVMTVIFQTAHVVPTVDFVDDEVAAGEEGWHRHQLRTTSNFANDSRVLTYLLGGLNFQIEHHLFPGICHTHYPALAKIVKSTALEYEMPYHSFETMREAVTGHYSMLKALGR